jgi:hypothetical protein
MGTDPEVLRSGSLLWSMWANLGAFFNGSTLVGSYWGSQCLLFKGSLSMLYQALEVTLEAQA